jgi:hypothetical protein
MIFVFQVLNQSAVDYINGSVSASQVGFRLGKQLFMFWSSVIIHMLVYLYRIFCLGNNLRSNIAVLVYIPGLRLVVSELLWLEVLYQIQTCLKVVQIHQSM